MHHQLQELACFGLELERLDPRVHRIPFGMVWQHRTLARLPQDDRRRVLDPVGDPAYFPVGVKHRIAR
jgi:hypothetical protein